MIQLHDQLFEIILWFPSCLLQWKINVHIFLFLYGFKTGQAGSGDFQRYLFISSKLAESDAMVDMIKDVELF